MLLEIKSFGPAATNVLLLACEKTRRAAVIDAPMGCTDWVIERVGALNLSPQMLLLTHSHWDHFADASQLKKRLNIPVYVHSQDAPNLRKPGTDGLPLMFEIEPIEPDHLLEGGEVLELGDLQLKVIHTPGHSPGGVCYLIEKENVMISGDTLFKGSIGRLDFPFSDAEKMWSSLDKLAKLPPETKVFPGHGEPTTLEDENWLKNAKNIFGG